MGECFQTLNLTNAYLFAAALQDEEICRNVLEIALKRKITAVRSHAEHTLFLDSDFKSVRFDVYALDAEEVSYDVEMQNDFGRDLPRRCRYYQAELDVSSLKPGEDYKELKPSYIIFICAFDPFGKGRYQYVFEEYCKEAGLALGDGTQKIFFNTNGTDSENITPQLLHLFEYLKQSTEEVANMHNDEKIQLIHRRVEYLKRDRKLEAGYMTMEEYIHSEAERRAKEMAETLAKPMAESMAKPLAESLAESLAASKIAQNIVALLAELGSVPEELRECIAAEKREDTLAAWLKLAARADSIEEFQSKM